MANTYISAEEAVKLIKSGDRVFLHGSAATPVHLIKALQERHQELKNVELVSITTLGDIKFDDPKYKDSFYFNSLFVSANSRTIVNGEYGDYVPVFLSEIPLLFKEGFLPIDVAMIQVSPPDMHGYCTLGTSVDITGAALGDAKKVIAQVNPNM